MTGDRDMFQCASDDVTVLYASTGGRGTEPVGPDEVARRYGIPPELVPDFIALRGDPSDGIPGAKGIGEKTAAELLSRYGSLDARARQRARADDPADPRRRSTTAARSCSPTARSRPSRTRASTRPPDCPTDWAGASKAAPEDGMNGSPTASQKAAAELTPLPRSTPAQSTVPARS